MVRGTWAAYIIHIDGQFTKSDLATQPIMFMARPINRKILGAAQVWRKRREDFALVVNDVNDIHFFMKSGKVEKWKILMSYLHTFFITKIFFKNMKCDKCCCICLCSYYAFFASFFLKSIHDERLADEPTSYSSIGQV